MLRILLSLFILLMGFSPVFATQTIHYMAGVPVSVSNGSGYSHSINNFRNTPRYANPPRTYYSGYHRRYSNPCRRVARPYGYYSNSRPVIVTKEVIVTPSNTTRNTTSVQRTYTRNGITYYN